MREIFNDNTDSENEIQNLINEVHVDLGRFFSQPQDSIINSELQKEKEQAMSCLDRGKRFRISGEISDLDLSLDLAEALIKGVEIEEIAATYEKRIKEKPEGEQAKIAQFLFKFFCWSKIKEIAPERCYKYPEYNYSPPKSSTDDFSRRFE